MWSVGQVRLILFILLGRQAHHCLTGGGQREEELEQQSVLYSGAQCDEWVTLLTALYRAKVSGQFNREFLIL